jgi:hypothetical protein
VEISCVSLKVLALVDIPQIRRLEQRGSDHSVMDQLLSHVFALGEWKRQVGAATSSGPPVTYESLVREYLSQAHRKNPDAGCPVGSWAGDNTRERSYWISSNYSVGSWILCFSQPATVP